MIAVPAAASSRAFVPFLDEIDGTLCLPASSTATDIRARIGSSPLRFPLMLDSGATLEDQVMSSSHAPASSRFGPYCDNIMGMNWRFPDNRTVRVGERVVKTTTGYDWLRFLLHSGHRFGRPLDYVIRLRPDCGHTATVIMDGLPVAVRQAAPELLRTSWMHWFDAVDVIEENGRCSLRVIVHSPVGEWPLFERYLTAFSIQHGLQIKVQCDREMPLDGCPDVVLKTSPERVITLAAELARAGDVRCVALCYSGVVHAYVNDTNHIGELVQPHIAGLHAVGGDWQSRHLPPPPATKVEIGWINTLEEVTHGG